MIIIGQWTKQQGCRGGDAVTMSPLNWHINNVDGQCTLYRNL